MVANVVIIGATLPVVGLSVAASSNRATPLFEYDNTGSGSWNTHGLTSEFGGHSIIGSAHGVVGDGEFALAARIENGDLGLFVRNANATSSFQDITRLAHAPAAASDPNVFIDPFGNVDLIYVSTQNRLVMISPHAMASPRISHTTSHVTSHVTLAIHALPPGGVGIRQPAPFDVTDLTVASHVPISPGLPSVSVSGMTAMILDRSTKGDAVVLPMQWHQLNVTPAIGTASDITTATGSPTLSNTPVSMPGVANAFAATTSAGHVEYFAQSVSGSWSVTDVTNLSASVPSTGPLSVATNGPTIFLASLSSAGHVQLFSASSSSASSSGARIQTLSPREYAHVSALSPTWKYRDLTTVINGSPVWTGNLFLSATLTSINVAGRAANWGDLYDYTNTLPSLTWTSKDVSLSAGATTAATTGVTGVLSDGTLQLFAPGQGILVARGVGVYAIPSKDWVRAVYDGWPIISETGGLGTLSAPWVGFTPPAALIHSPDYLMGQSIVASKKRVTWLSFWTVSGPLTPAEQTAAGYYNHGFLAGQWVAQQIDQYHLSGLNLKPNWVILDPEGFPDNHSGLDAPAGASKAAIAKHASYWKAMLNGWATGINDVDPSLHPGVYASMSEYRNYALASAPLPVFQAIAFGDGGPVRIAGSNGPNILGYIAFNGACTPTATLHAQENTLLNPPWAGQFNTLQFNSGVYCAP
jgi:hypothetical protein